MKNLDISIGTSYTRRYVIVGGDLVLNLYVKSFEVS